VEKQGRRHQYTPRETYTLEPKLNEGIVDELPAATAGLRQGADFSDVVGRWTPDSPFDEILATQRQIDPDKWK
jgi:hypothetical protein